MSLNSPLQTSGSKAPDSRPDPEFLLLEAVRQRHGQECLDRLQRCVHRRGLDWLHQFQMVTLPALEDREAAAGDAAVARLDAVGGAMLLVHAELHRHGLVFPPYPHRHRIETEGLSMMALDMGVLSWGLPFLEILHI